MNSAAEPKALVEASFYPPRGRRSVGPSRGLLYGGPDDPDRADDTIVRLDPDRVFSGIMEQTHHMR